VGGSYDQENVYLDSIKYWVFLDELSDYSAAQSEFLSKKAYPLC
jgi:hypothetical protein